MQATRRSSTTSMRRSGVRLLLILLCPVLLFIAWNGLRSHAVPPGTGERSAVPPPRPAASPEPPARRLLADRFRGALGDRRTVATAAGHAARHAVRTSCARLRRAPRIGCSAWSVSVSRHGPVTRRRPRPPPCGSNWASGCSSSSPLAVGGHAWPDWGASAGGWSSGSSGRRSGVSSRPGLTVLFGAPGGVLLYVVGGRSSSPCPTAPGSANDWGA